LEGNVSGQIIHYSNNSDTNLIMLSSHGQGGISGWNMSSIATKIIQQAYTSIMIICPYPTPEKDPIWRCYHRILAPVDGSKRAEYGLAIATNLARAQVAELLIAQVIKPPELPRRVPLSEREQGLVNQVVDANRIEATAYLDELQKRSNYPETKTILLIDNLVTQALYTLVDQKGIDLVVLTAHGFSGNPNLPYGNVAVNFLTYFKVPLLIVQDFPRDRLVQARSENHLSANWNKRGLS
jgi:nucleotide-binding universal stress UspA family protein